MLLSHIGYLEGSKRLEEALDFCCGEGSMLKVTGFREGATTKEFTEYLLNNIFNKTYKLSKKLNFWLILLI